MYTTYLNTTNSTTGGTPLDTTGKNVEVYRMIVGNPVANGNIWGYNENNVGNVSNITGLVMKMTLPSSFATGQLPFTIDFTDQAGHGMMLLGGGTIAIDQTMQVSVIWDYAHQPQVGV